MAGGHISFEYPLHPGVAPDPILKPFNELAPPALSFEQLGDDSQAGKLLRQQACSDHERRRVAHGEHRTRRRPTATRRRPSRALVAAAACGPLAILLPLGFTLYRAATFGVDDAIELLWRPLVGELLVNTLSITLAATLACTLLGTALAWFIERTDLPARPLWTALAAARSRCRRSSRVTRGCR